MFTNKLLLIFVILLALPLVCAVPGVPTLLTADNTIFFETPFYLVCNTSVGGVAPVYYEIYDYSSFLSGYQSYNTNQTLVDQGATGSRLGIVMNVSSSDILVYSFNKPAGCDVTNVTVYNYTGGGWVTSGNFTGNEAVLDPTPTLLAWTDYRIETNIAPAHYYTDNTPLFPVQYPLFNISKGSGNGADVINRLYNIESLKVKYYTDPLSLVSNDTVGVTTNISITAGTSGNWSCRAKDVNGVSALIENRTLIHANFSSCDPSNTSALNFTMKDEETLGSLNATDFLASLALSSGTYTKTYFFDLHNRDNYSLCISPNNYYLNVTGYVQYDSDMPEYSYPRLYYFEEAEVIGNSVQDISLYQLADDLSTAVTYTVIRGVNVAPGILLHLQRYNPGTGSYYLVAMAKTNSEGKDIIYLRLTDAWYRLFAYEDGTLVYSGETEHVTSTSKTIYLTGESGQYNNYWEQWEHLQSIVWNMSFNNASQLASVTFDDASGAATHLCFDVYKQEWNQSTHICSNCTTSNSGNLGCSILENNQVYKGVFSVYKNPTNYFQMFWDLRQKVKDTIDPKEGVFYTILITATMTFMAIWNPAAAIVLCMTGIGFMFFFGYFDIAFGLFIGLAVSAAFLVMRLRS